MKKGGIALFFATVIFAGLIGLAFGSSGYVTDFNDFYPTTALRGSCTVCHTSAPSLNPYGNAWSGSGFDFAAIQALDSDGDAFSNIAEIQAGTYPGNPASKPAPPANLSTGILWRNTTTGSNAVWYMNGMTVTSVVNLPGLSNPAYTIAGMGDFNGDGQPDILWRNTTTGANAVWYMNGATVIGVVNLPGLADPSYTIAGVGDFNGDGRPDILWRNTTTGRMPSGT